MSIRPPGDDGDDASDTDLRTLLDRPLHAVELENGEGQRNLRNGRWLGPSRMVWLPAERELNPVVRNRSDRSAANFVPGRDVELLPDFSAQHTSKMSGMFAHQSSGVSSNLVGDPAAERHESVLSSQLSVLSNGTRQD